MRNYDCPRCEDRGYLSWWIIGIQICPVCNGEPSINGPRAVTRNRQAAARRAEYDPADLAMYERQCKGNPPPPPLGGETSVEYFKRTGIQPLTPKRFK